MQGLADAAGKGGDWQSLAAANGIENPRLLAPGALVDLDARPPKLGATLGVEGGLAVAAPKLSVSIEVGA